MNKSIFLSTAGRCGTHWMKHILSYTLELKSDYQSYLQINPNKVALRTSKDAIREMKKKEEEHPGGSIFVGHNPIIELMPLKEMVNIIAVIRDPRDICVSATYYMMKNDEEFDQNKFDQLFQGEFIGGGPNPDYNESFIKDIKKIPHVVLKFEDMVSNSYESMSIILDSFSYEYDKELLKTAIEKYSFKTLSSGREVGVEDRGNHYRKGLIGDWKNYFTEEKNKEFCERHKLLMERWGYDE